MSGCAELGELAMSMPPERPLAGSETSRLAALALMGPIVAVGVAGTAIWAFVQYPSMLFYRTSSWAYPTLFLVSGAFLAQYRWSGIVAFVLAAAVFNVLAVNLKGMYVFPGTFDSWRISGGELRTRILVAGAIGLSLGLARSYWPVHRPPIPVPKFGAVWVAWGMTTLLAVLNVFLTLRFRDPTSAFAPNQPIGVAIVWMAMTITLGVAHVMAREEA